MITHPHLLDIEELKTCFFTFEGTATAVDDVSFFLEKGEVLGIVGESGCGKSVTAQSIMRLIPVPPGKIVKGSVFIVIIATCNAGWVKYGRTMRGSVLEIKQEAYIMAAKATGSGDTRILLKHLLPNAVPP
ncbi:MAG: ATP-binding cassette domain-containing protein, partial [Desulfobacterales bacterium]